MGDAWEASDIVAGEAPGPAGSQWAQAVRLGAGRHFARKADGRGGHLVRRRRRQRRVRARPPHPAGLVAGCDRRVRTRGKGPTEDYTEDYREDYTEDCAEDYTEDDRECGYKFTETTVAGHGSVGNHIYRYCSFRLSAAPAAVTLNQDTRHRGEDARNLSRASLTGRAWDFTMEESPGNPKGIETPRESLRISIRLEERMESSAMLGMYTPQHSVRPARGVIRGVCVAHRGGRGAHRPSIMRGKELGMIRWSLRASVGASADDQSLIGEPSTQRERARPPTKLDSTQRQPRRPRPKRHGQRRGPNPRPADHIFGSSVDIRGARERAASSAAARAGARTDA
eukprot:gene2537-biopygen3952